MHIFNKITSFHFASYSFPKKLALLSYCLFFSSTYLQAQELFLTAQYDEQGIPNPDFSSNTWKIDALEGSFLYVVFRTQKEITDSKLYLFVDKKLQEEFVEYETKKIYINDKRSWAAIKFTFRQTGTYRVSIANADKEILVTEEVRIFQKTKILFSSQLDEHKKPSDSKKVFELQAAALPIYISIRDETPFETTLLRIVIEKRMANQTYTKYAEEKFPIEPTWQFTFFEQLFEEAGTYRITVKKADETLFGVAFLKIE